MPRRSLPATEPARTAADYGADAPHWSGFGPGGLVVPEVSLARRGRDVRLTVHGEPLTVRARGQGRFTCRGRYVELNPHGDLAYELRCRRGARVVRVRLYS